MGAAVYYSDDSFGSKPVKSGRSKAPPPTPSTPIGPFTPTISGVLGHVEGDDPAYVLFNGFDSYTYWNVGLALAVEKLTFDFRYWDTDDAVERRSLTLFTCSNGYCDERFVFSATVALP